MRKKEVFWKIHCLSSKKYLTVSAVMVYDSKAVLQRGLVKWYDKGLQNL